MHDRKALCYQGFIDEIFQSGLAAEAICAEPTDVCCHKLDTREQPEDSTFGEWPNTCLLFKKGTDTVIGGASLLTPNSLLTAAHKFEYVFHQTK